MAYVDGRASRFRIAGADGVLRDISMSVREVLGLPGAHRLNDVTALGDEGATYAPGDESVAFTLRGLFDGGAAHGADAALSSLRYHSAPAAFEYAPAGMVSGNVRYAGNCWMTAYELHSRSGALVSWSATLQVQGRVRRESV